MMEEHIISVHVREDSVKLWWSTHWRQSSKERENSSKVFILTAQIMSGTSILSSTWTSLCLILLLQSSWKFDSFNILRFFYLGEIAKAIEIFEDIFASISYHELVFNAENAWHASMSSMLRLMGADTVDEQNTNTGRIDCVLKCPEKIYIIEYRFNQSAENAIRQIKENRYYEPYSSCREEVHLLGINLSTGKRNIIEWKDEKFPLWLSSSIVTTVPCLTGDLCTSNLAVCVIKITFTN